MKKTITTLALALSICGVATAQNRSMGQNASKPSPDAKLISTTRDGDSLVSKWLVMDVNDDGTNEFTLHYQMNLTKLVSSYDRNSAELKSLHSFMNEISSDKYKTLTEINIMGYASPDGTLPLNERLSKARATDFRTYINKNFDLSSVKGSTTGDALKWRDALSLVKESSIPSKNEVVALITSSNTDDVIEQKLKAMSSSWSYMCREILPKMRYVDMQVKYNSWHEEETRTAASGVANRRSKGSNNSAATSTQVYFFVVEDIPAEVMMVENDYTLIDYPEYTDSYRSHRGFSEKYKERSTNRKYRSKYSYR